MLAEKRNFIIIIVVTLVTHILSRKKNNNKKEKKRREVTKPLHNLRTKRQDFQFKRNTIGVFVVANDNTIIQNITIYLKKKKYNLLK